MSHAFVVGGLPSEESERDIRVGGVDSVPSGVFASLGGSPSARECGGLDYVALGHLHRPQEIRSAGGAGGPAGSGGADGPAGAGEPDGSGGASEPDGSDGADESGGPGPRPGPVAPSAGPGCDQPHRRVAASGPLDTEDSVGIAVTMSDAHRLFPSATLLSLYYASSPSAVREKGA